MELLKKFVGRRDAVGDEHSCYHLNQGETIRPPSVVTVTAFDDDDVFIAVARVMLFRYEYEGMSETDAINSVLLTPEDKRSFLEALELRNSNMYIDHDEELEDSPINEFTFRTRSIFGDTLKLLWRESALGCDGVSDMQVEEPSCDHGFRRRLKTPKNFRLHSPIRCALSETGVKRPSAPTNPNCGGRPRRRFFPEPEQPKSCSRVRLDFKLATQDPVKSLHLDGLPSPALGHYAPPSPIATSQKTKLARM